MFDKIGRQSIAGLALTCESFFNTAEWIWIYSHFGYSGDYEFIYFE